jgi:TolA-binding protein
MKEVMMMTKNSNADKSRPENKQPITPKTKNFEVKEMSQMDFDLDNGLLDPAGETSYCLENTKSLKFELRQVNTKNKELEDVNSKLKRQLDKMNKRLKGNEEFMQLLRSEMMEVHKENKMLNSRKRERKRESSGKRRKRKVKGFEGIDVLKELK